jgi:integrase/recombinase XerD
MLVVEAVQRFLTNIEMVRRLSLATVASYKNDLYIFLKYLSSCGITTVDKITREIVVEFIIQQQTLNPLKAATIRRRGHALMSFFKFCFSMGYIRVSPMTGVQLPKKEKIVPKGLADEEYARFRDKQIWSRTKPWLGIMEKAICDLLSYLAPRFDEVRSALITDLDFERNKILIHGKGRKERLLPMHPVLVESLRKYLGVRPKVKCDYLFVSADGRGRLGKNGLYYLFRKQLKRCGIGSPGVTPHKLRHTLALWVLRKTNNDLLSVQKILGHESIETTARYLQCTDERLKQAIDNAF